MSVKTVKRPVKTAHDHERERGHCDFPLESSHEPPFIQNAVIRAVAAAGMHYLMKMAGNASDTDSNAILAFLITFHMEEEKEEYIQGYICTSDFTEASYVWQIPPA